MARPRKFVRIIEAPNGIRRSDNGDGREIHGLSYARVSKPGQGERGSYYTIRDGKRQHLSTDLAEAVRIIQGKPEPLPDYLDPPVFPPEVEERIKAGKGPISDKNLSDCLDVWAEAKRAENVSDEHLEDVSRYFNAFAACIGDLPVSELTAEHFTTFRNSVNARRSYQDAKGKPKQHSILWVQRHHKWVKHILKYVRWSYPSWGLPDGTLEWASVYQVVRGREKYNSPKKNRQRMPVDAFKRLLAVAELWSQTAVEGSSETQSDRAKRRQQKAKPIEGLRAIAILKLVANCGLDNVDIMRIRWANLKLDQDVPYMDFPRPKTEAVTGAIERRTPLLPQTVRALQALRAVGNPSPFVFVAGRGKPYTKPSFRSLADRLLSAARIKAWTFKHLRNVGGTLAKANGHKDRIQEFLGHNETGTNKFYVDDVGPEYLIPVVDAIGAEYFDGDKVMPRGLRVVG